MPMMVFVIIIIEVALLSNQLLELLSRPHEKKRLYHLFLLLLLILYNLAEGLFPDENIAFVPPILQNFLGYGFGYVFAAYIPFYIYKTAELPELRLHGKYGFLVVLLPLFFFYGILYPVNQDIAFTRKYVYIIPAMYGAFLYWISLKEIFKQYRAGNDKSLLFERMCVYFSVFPVTVTPIFGGWLGFSKPTETIMFNIGFIVANAIFMKQIVKRSRDEYNELQLRNTTLQKEVSLRTSDLKKANSELKKTNFELEKINEERTNAFVNIIHETKTPLTLVNNYLDEYISNHKETPELSVIKNSVHKLSKDIGNIFDTERLVKGFEVYDHQQVTNFSQILQDNVLLSRPFFEKKGIIFSDNIENEVYIKADPRAIISIVNNLFENAIKFSSTDGKVHIILESVEENVMFSVTDNGIGIPVEFQKKIFEPYYQINTHKKNFQGMGLGLPIIKKIVVGLNGQIHINSNPKIENGTTINVLLSKYQLPNANNSVIQRYSVQKNESLNIPDFNIIAKPYNHGKPLILVVEDSKATLQYLHKKLSEEYNVEYAFTGSEALKKLHKPTAIPDLIVTDIMMDEMDGFGFMKVLAELKEYTHIPIICLSAKTTKMDRLRALKLGAIDFVQKPFSYHELACKIQSVLKNTGNQKKAIHNDIISGLKGLDTKDTLLSEKLTMEKLNKNYKLYNLTPTEIVVANMVRDGFTYPQIAKTRIKSEHTIKKQIENIFAKCNVHSQAELFKKLEN